MINENDTNLAAVIGIVRGHKGAIHVYSEPGRGTTIKVLFPVSSATKLDEPSAPVSGASGVGSTVLFVDDEPSVRDVARDILQSAGYQVIVAGDGQEAIGLFSSRGDIDAVILDLMMPKMSGVEALKRLKELDRSVPVLLSSGYNEQEATSQLVGDELAGFVQKPYRLRDLLAAIEGVLGKAR